MQVKTNDVATQDRVFGIVRAELLRVRRAQTPGFSADIRMESCLATDVGLDSLSLVEAVVALEQALAIEHLSLETLHERCAHDGGRFTVAALVNFCMEQAAV